MEKNKGLSTLKVAYFILIAVLIAVVIAGDVIVLGN